MALEPLCPDPLIWRMTAIVPEKNRLVVHLEPLRHAVACPMCGTRSQRVHSRYRRTPWDLPWSRWPVQLVVYARRFFCDHPACPPADFCGTVSGGVGALCPADGTPGPGTRGVGS